MSEARSTPPSTQGRTSRTLKFEDLSIERPQKAENGDFSCSLAMKLARPMRMNPRAIGQAIVDSLPDSPLVGEARGLPVLGFVNFSLDEDWLQVAGGQWQ